MSTSELMVAIHPGETYTLEEFMTCHEGKMGLVSVCVFLQSMHIVCLYGTQEHSHYRGLLGIN